MRIAANAECALRPAQHAIRFTFAIPEKQVDLFAALERRHFIHVGVQISSVAAKHPHGDDSWHSAFLALQNGEARFRPDFTSIPEAGRVEAAKSRNGGRLEREIFKLQPRKGGRACGDGDQRDAEDRKSTRLNSSHVEISYAVFCLKK